MLKKALAIAAGAVFAFLPMSAEARENDDCFVSSDNDRICYMQLPGDGNYAVAIQDNAHYWPTVMQLECYTDGSNYWEFFGSKTVNDNVAEWYADRVCERF